MKPLLILARIIIVGILWSVFFMESIRVIMLRNWRFDILNSEHWEIAWDLWLNSWVISEAKEWAFVLIIISFIPLWFTGWIALSLVSWGKLFIFILTLPWKLFKNFFYKPVKIISVSTGVTPIRRKKSYKEIRPRAVKSTFNDRMELAQPAPMSMGMAPPPPIGMHNVAPVMAPPRHQDAPLQPEKKNFDHSLFKFDDSFDDLDFDIDAFEVEKKEEKPAPTPEPVFEPRNFDNFTPPYDNKREEREPYRERNNDRDNRRDKDRDNKDRNRDRDDRDNRRDSDRDNRRDKDRNQSRDSRRDNDRDSRRDKDRDNKDRNRDRDDRDNRRDKDRNQTRDDRDTRREAPRDQGSPQPTGSCADIIKQKGYDIITRATVKNTVIDYIGVSNNRICLCLLDKEPGDWLADEERFNDEEPLWFSESSHRISPVRKIDIAKQAILDKLDNSDIDYYVDAYVIIQIGNIINAEDMFEIWNDMNINVTRIDRGTPKEIKLFARALPDADRRASPSKFDKIEKIIRNLS